MRKRKICGACFNADTGCVNGNSNTATDGKNNTNGVSNEHTGTDSYKHANPNGNTGTDGNAVADRYPNTKTVGNTYYGRGYFAAYKNSYL